MDAKKKRTRTELWETIPEAPKLTNLKKDYGNIPKRAIPALEAIGAPHVEAFDWALEQGLQKALTDLPSINFEIPSKHRVMLRITEAKIGNPTVPVGTVGAKDFRVYPTECRQRYTTYRGNLSVTVCWWLDGIRQVPIERALGAIPIMVKSKFCNLRGLSPKGLVQNGEHETEFGGYFIAKGHEKLIRLLMMTRANYPVFLIRSVWENRGKCFSDKGVLMRCVGEDRSTLNNVLHYLTDGSVKIMFNVGRELFYVPLVMILKALVNVTDQYIFKQCLAGYEDDSYFKSCVADMLRDLHRNQPSIQTHTQAKAFIGSKFRSRIQRIIGTWATDAEISDYMITKGICIQCSTPAEKFHFLVFALQKLFAGVQEKCIVETPDHLMLQEVLLGGHLYLQLLKDKLFSWLQALQFQIQRKLKTSKTPDTLRHADLAVIVNKTYHFDRVFESFIATGNVPVNTGQGLSQVNGLTILVENLNRNRYLAHFRSVHRGAFFQEMRTTETRQLQPDAWGFVCPVHTPDGAPCGLLNHLSAFCQIVTQPQDDSILPSILVNFGMIPIDSASIPYPIRSCFKVILNGCVLGYVKETDATKIVNQLRLLKIHGDGVPKYTEIALVPKLTKGQFPGLFLFTSLARMMRPVIHIASGKVEYIGTFEQVHLDICVIPEEAYPGITTHQEINNRSFLSNLASLIPMPDCNQSPRNMYQCQMGKQTMGSPYMTYHRFAENKLYRLHFPGTPLFRPVHHDYLHLDDYPSGTNAIVAVISYTGYDMEDAMIISKTSYERGFGHGCIYKSEHIDLKVVVRNTATKSTFARNPSDQKVAQKLDIDGLPYIGVALDKGDPYYSFFNAEAGNYIVKKFGGTEKHYVDSVKLKGNDIGTMEKSSVVIAFRVPKNPRMGDKFASRAGQKGICSYLWPAEDLPVTESGLIPDIVFNPHGFPSRMTIAMMIECMAGKAATLHGHIHDATPFKFSEEDPAIDYFGQLLERGGYNYYGTERMYSGTDGRELTADIFFGIVHYQRLRHMVSEKWQVRSTGPIDPITHQPNKGRRRGGGVRFGEMEKDCLLAHGASFLLQDRLFYGSDRTIAHICTDCGSLISPIIKIPPPIPGSRIQEIPRIRCGQCGKEDKIEMIEIPYVFKYLVEQLASVNIKIKMNTSHV